MTTTTVLSDDTATIVRDDTGTFQWGAVVAGSVIATAITFLLVSFGSAVGLSLVSAHGATSWGIKTFLTAGAIYFLVAQAFGFAVGGHVTGRLLGTSADDSEEETFRADAHGLAVWGLGVIFGLAVLALTAGPTISAGATSRAASQPVNYFTDKLFRPGSVPDMPAAQSAEGSRPALSDIRGEASRLLAAEIGPNGSASDDHRRLVSLVAQVTGLSNAGAVNRVNSVEDDMRNTAKAAADAARKAASYISIWTTLALLFSAAVCVAATVSARWEHDRAVFGRNRAALH